MLQEDNKPMPAQFEAVELVGLGWEKSDPTRILQSFVREHFRIHYVTKGAGWLELKTRAYRLTEGMGFVIFPGEASNYYPDKANPWEYFWIGAKGDGMEALAQYASLTRAAPIYQTTNLPEQARTNFVDLYASVIGAASCVHSASYCLFRLFDNVVPLGTARRGNSYYFEKSLHYIHQNYMNPISIHDLAASLAIDRTYLYKLFRKNIDCSPQTYLINHRISKACDLLLSTEKSVSEVAYNVGFNDLSDFSKQFKKRTSMTAKEFREVSEQKNNCEGGTYF